MKRRGIFAFVITLCLFALSCGAFFMQNETQGGDISPRVSATNYIEIGEIFDMENCKFIESTTNTFLSYLSGSDLTMGNADGIKNLVANGNITSETMRKNNSGKDCLVVLGGLEWWVTYVSKDKNDNVIVTLWMGGTNQLSGGKYDTTTFDDYGSAPWNPSPGLKGGDLTKNYPAEMYGTSYLHAAVLNNGGYYTTDGSTLKEFYPTEDSIFAPFTIGKISRYIVTPRDVEWQETQSSKALGYGVYGVDYSNESWVEMPDENFKGRYGSSTNFTNKAHYGDWADDRLWIPSRLECGDSNSREIWKISEDVSWTDVTAFLRTYDSGIYGVVSEGGGYVYPLPLNSGFGVRPALHLNLSKIANCYDNWDDHAATSFAGGDGTKQSPYEIATAEQLAYFAKLSRNVSSIGPYLSSTKYYKITANIDLQAHEWKGIGIYGKAEAQYMCLFNLDGGNHEIRNMHSTSAQGFINYCGNSYGSCTTKNLVFRDCEIISNSGLCGIFAGFYFIGYIQNVSVFDSYVDAGSGTAGAICGAGLNIKGGYVENTTVVGDTAGGICGDSSEVSCFIRNCSFVNGTVRGADNAYGIGVYDRWTEVMDCSVINGKIFGGERGADLFTGAVTQETSLGKRVVNSNFGYGVVNGVETKLMMGKVDDWSAWSYIPSLNGDLPVQEKLFHVGGFASSADIYNLLKRKGFVETTR